MTLLPIEHTEIDMGGTLFLPLVFRLVFQLIYDKHGVVVIRSGFTGTFLLVFIIRLAGMACISGCIRLGRGHLTSDERSAETGRI